MFSLCSHICGVDFIFTLPTIWALAEHEHGGIGSHGGRLLGCVCPYKVCLALPVTGGGRAQCVIGFERSAALTFEQPV